MAQMKRVSESVSRFKNLLVACALVIAGLVIVLVSPASKSFRISESLDESSIAYADVPYSQSYYQSYYESYYQADYGCGCGDGCGGDGGGGDGGGDGCP